MKELASLVYEQRKSVNLTQEEFAECWCCFNSYQENRAREYQSEYGKGKPCIKHVWSSIGSSRQPKT